MSCFDKLKQAFPQFSDKEIKRIDDIFKEINERAAYNNDVAKELVNGAVNEIKLGKLNDIRTKLDSGLKEERNLRHIFQENFKGDILEGVLSKFEGTTRNVDGKNINVDGLYRNNRGKHERWFVTTLRRSGLLKIIKDSANTRKIIEAFDRYEPSFKNSNDPFEQIAHAIVTLNSNLLKMQQLAGSTIKGTKNYLFMQTHNTDLILGDTKKWVDNIVTKLDLDKSFGVGTTEDQARAILNKMADNLEDIGSSGISSVLGGKRELHFKNASAFMDYNDVYGYRNLLDGISHSIKNSSRKAALVQVFGNDPAKSVKKLLKKAKEVSPGNNSLDDVSAVWKAYQVANGIHERPGRGLSQGATNFAIGVKAWQNLTLLGRASFSAMEDIATTIQTIKLANGDSYATGMVKYMGEFFNSLSPEVRGETAEAVGFGLEGSMREMMETFGSFYNNPSKTLSTLHWANTKYMWVTGLESVTNHMRYVAARLHAKELYKSIMAKSPNSWQSQVLKATDLSELDLSNIRNLIGKSGDKLASVDLIDFAKDSEFSVPKGTNLEAYKQELSNKMGAYFVKMINSGSPIPQAKEIRQLGQAAPINNPYRVALSFLTQFQGTMLRIHNLNAELARASNPKGELMNASAIKTMASSIMFLGVTHFAMNKAKNFVKNGEIDFEPNSDNLKQLTEALLTSGAAGLYVSYLTDITNPFSQYGASGARMPSPALDYLAKAVQSFTPPNEKKLRKLLIRSTPGQNLWLRDNALKKIMLESSF